MKWKDHLIERYRERNKPFLLIDIFFRLLATSFAIWLLFIIIPALLGSNQSDDYAAPLLLLASMTLFVGLSYAVQIIEMFVTGKKRYFAITLGTAIIALGIAIIEFYWIFDK